MKPAPPPFPIEILRDLEYSAFGPRRLLLDLFLPRGAENPPLIVYLHGGSWRNLDRKTVSSLVPRLVEHGYAAASVDYRLSSEAIFPAQVHDCRGAIRWLRAHASFYGYDPATVFIMGRSAGAHLALLAGLNPGNPYYEGTTAGHLDKSSAVSGIIDFCGPTDFILRALDQPETTNRPDGKVHRLLGGSVAENPELARLASPAFQLSPNGPPILAFHGSADQTVLPNQSQRLATAARSIGHPVQFHLIPGAAHGDPKPTPENPSPRRLHDSPRNLQIILDFLAKHQQREKIA